MINYHMTHKIPYKGRYQVREKLEKGGQASTFLVQDLLEKKLKVIKQIKVIPPFQEKIRKEVKFLTKLGHINIVKAYDCHLDYLDQDQYLLLVMEHVKGGQLRAHYKQLSQVQTYKYYMEIKSALQYIHGFKIVHRDLKLRNILLDKDRNVKLIDFGLSTQLQEITHVNSVYGLGTEYYESPQFRDMKMVRIQLDYWQLGIVMIQLLTHTQIEQLIKRKNEDGEIYYYHPAANQKFLDQIFQRFDIRKQFQLILKNLLERNYKNRKFVEGIEIKFPIIKLCLRKLTNSQLFEIIKPHSGSLIQLNCSNNFLSDQCGKTIMQLKKLSKLNISGNDLTDKFVMYINDLLIRLTSLNLAFTNITDQGLFLIIKYAQLIECLDISYTRVTSKSIITLSQLKLLSSLAIWSDTYYFSRYHQHIYLNRGINHDKYWNNDISITKQCIKQISKLRLKQLTINLKQNSADQIINRMEQDSSCIEAKGKLSKQNIEKIVGMKKLKRLYLNGVKDYVLKELKSKKLESVGLVNSNIVIKELVNYLSNCEQLRDLNLGDNNIGVQGATAIANRLTNLTTLYLSSNNIGDQGATAIANRLTNLTTLSLYYNNIGVQGATAIANRLTNLTTLHLTWNNIGVQGATAIANRLTNLTTLDLNYNNIGEKGATAIANRLTNLTTLSLSSNNIGVQGATAIANRLTNLTTLDLNYNNIGEKGATAIANRLTNLTTLSLYYNNIGVQGATAIANRLTNLTTLHLTWNNIGVQGATAIANRLTNLTTLSLYYNNIGVQGATAIANRLTNLTTLHLSWNNIGDQGATAIANRLTNLTTLHLSWNNIGDQGATAIANRLTNLTTLDLNNNNIGVQGATAIANRLTNLTTLDLNNNNIGDQGATAIANRLTNLITLNLNNNNIGVQGATAIANRLTNLTTLHLSWNNIGDQGATAIANRLTNLTTLSLWDNNINALTKKSIRQRLKHIKLSI